MKVLYFTRGYTWHDRQFLEAFCSFHWDLALLSIYPAASERKRIEVPNKVRDLGYLDRRGAVDSEHLDGQAGKLVKAISSFYPDIVYAGPICDCAYLATLQRTVPVVACSWGFDILYECKKDKILKARAIAALTHCRGLVADCETVWARCKSMSNFDSPNRAVFPWGIDRSVRRVDSGVRERMRRDLGWGSAAIALSTRNFEEIYNLEVLICGFGIAAEKNTSLRLIMAGGGSKCRQLHDIVRSLGLSPKVHFAGVLDRQRIEALYRSSDIYVSCALTDGTSVSMLEAMDNRLLPILSNLPSNREWVRTGSNGWLVRCDDPRSVSASLLEAAGLPEVERRRIISHNLKIVQKRANWSTNVLKLKALCYKVAQEFPC